MPQQYQYVKLPDGSYGRFRANQTDQEIRSLISRDFPQAYAGAAGQQPISLEEAQMRDVGPSREALWQKPMRVPLPTGIPYPVKTTPSELLGAIKKYGVDPFDWMAEKGGEAGAWAATAPTDIATQNLSSQFLEQHPNIAAMVGGARQTQADIGQFMGSTVADPRMWPFLLEGAAERAVLPKGVIGPPTRAASYLSRLGTVARPLQRAARVGFAAQMAGQATPEVIQASQAESPLEKLEHIKAATLPAVFAGLGVLGGEEPINYTERVARADQASAKRVDALRTTLSGAEPHLEYDVQLVPKKPQLMLPRGSIEALPPDAKQTVLADAARIGQHEPPLTESMPPADMKQMEFAWVDPNQFTNRGTRKYPGFFPTEPTPGLGEPKVNWQTPEIPGYEGPGTAKAKITDLGRRILRKFDITDLDFVNAMIQAIERSKGGEGIKRAAWIVAEGITGDKITGLGWREAADKLRAWGKSQEFGQGPPSRLEREDHGIPFKKPQGPIMTLAGFQLSFVGYEAMPVPGTLTDYGTAPANFASVEEAVEAARNAQLRDVIVARNRKDGTIKLLVKQAKREGMLPSAGEERPPVETRPPWEVLGFEPQEKTHVNQGFSLPNAPPIEQARLLLSVRRALREWERVKDRWVAVRDRIQNDPEAWKRMPTAKQAEMLAFYDQYRRIAEQEGALRAQESELSQRFLEAERRRQIAKGYLKSVETGRLDKRIKAMERMRREMHGYVPGQYQAEAEAVPSGMSPLQERLMEGIPEEFRKLAQDVEQGVDPILAGSLDRADRVQAIHEYFNIIRDQANAVSLLSDVDEPISAAYLENVKLAKARLQELGASDDEIDQAMVDYPQPQELRDAMDLLVRLEKDNRAKAPRSFEDVFWKGSWRRTRQRGAFTPSKINVEQLFDRYLKALFNSATVSDAFQQLNQPTPGDTVTALRRATEQLMQAGVSPERIAQMEREWAGSTPERAANLRRSKEIMAREAAVRIKDPRRPPVGEIESLLIRLSEINHDYHNSADLTQHEAEATRKSLKEEELKIHMQLRNRGFSVEKIQKLYRAMYSHLNRLKHRGLTYPDPDMPFTALQEIKPDPGLAPRGAMAPPPESKEGGFATLRGKKNMPTFTGQGLTQLARTRGFESNMAGEIKGPGDQNMRAAWLSPEGTHFLSAVKMMHENVLRKVFGVMTNKWDLFKIVFEKGWIRKASPGMYYFEYNQGEDLSSRFEVINEDIKRDLKAHWLKMGDDVYGNGGVLVEAHDYQKGARRQSLLIPLNDLFNQHAGNTHAAWNAMVLRDTQHITQMRQFLGGQEYLGGIAEGPGGKLPKSLFVYRTDPGFYAKLYRLPEPIRSIAELLHVPKGELLRTGWRLAENARAIMQHRTYDTNLFLRQIRQLVPVEDLSIQKLGYAIQGDAPLSSLTPAGQAAVKMIREFTKDQDDLMRSVYGTTVPLQDPMHYLTQIWDLPSGRDVRERASATLMNDPFLRERVVDSYKEGIEKHQLTPKYSNILDILRVRADYATRAMVNQMLANQLSALGVILPEGLAKRRGFLHWPKAVDAHALDKATYGGTTKRGDTVLVKRPVYVHPDFLAPINVAFGTPFSSGFANFLDAFANTTKKLMLSASFFHPIALSEQDWAIYGIRGKFGEALKGTYFLNRDMYRGIRDAVQTLRTGVPSGDPPIWRWDPGMIKDAIDAGLPLKTEDAAARVVTLLQEMGKNSGKIAHTLGYAPRFLGDAAFVWDTSLWRYFDEGRTLQAYFTLVDDEMRKLGPGADPERVKQMKRDVARHVAEVRGHALEQLMLTPKAKQVLSFMLLAPDWVYSNLRTAMSVFERGTHGSLARKWAVGAGVSWFLTTQMLNYTFSSYYNVEDRHGKRGGHFTWDNPGAPVSMFGRQLPVSDNSVNVVTGYNQDGTQRYIRFGKGFRDSVLLLLSLADPNLAFQEFGYKMSVPMREVLVQLTGHEPGSGYEAISIGKPGESEQRIAAAADVMVPFPLQDALREAEHRIAPTRFPIPTAQAQFLSQPTARGLTMQRAASAYAQALKSGDVDAQMRVMQAVHANHINVKAVIRLAMMQLGKERNIEQGPKVNYNERGEPIPTPAR